VSERSRADVEAEVDRLHALPLEEFTEARNTLAGRFAKEGDPEAAGTIRSLSKPTIVAWTINQLVRSERKQLGALLEAADELRQAQERALAGGGADRVRHALDAERKAVQALAASARRLLTEAGRSASDGTINRISSTLHAAVADPEARPRLEQGRLEAEVESAGFAPLTGLRPAATRSAQPTRKQKDELAERRRAKAEARERLRSLREELRDLRRKAREAEQTAGRLAQEALAARERAEKAQAEAHRVEQALKAAEQREKV
jgi:chromosome segregation ATPase